MRSLQEMASEGARKLQNASSTMAASYDAAKGRMVSNYNATPFGPNTKAKYANGIQNARFRVPDVNKWQTNWIEGVSR